MTLIEALHFGRQRLQSAGVPDYEYDANALLQFASGKNLSVILGDPGQELMPEAEAAYRACLSRREERVPLQHILGEVCFYGYDFHVREGVLIPRSDTEHLVEHALELAPDRPVRFLDLCTGSGAIGISVKLMCPEAGVTISDISPHALAVARENWERLRRSSATTLES